MAYTATTDVFDPQVLGDMLSAKFPDKLVLANLGFVQVVENHPLANAGDTFTIPFFKKIGQFSDTTEGTAIVPGKISTGSENALVQRGGIALSVSDEAILVSYADPAAEVVDQLARRAAEYIDGKLVTELEHTPNVLTVAANMDQNVIARGMAKLGDNHELLRNGGAIVMHSKQYFDLLQSGAIQNNYQSGMDVMKTGAIGYLMGLPVYTSDRVTTTPFVSGTPDTLATYSAYIIAPNALALYYQRKALVEYDRDILMRMNVFAATIHFAPHLYGWDAKTSAVVAENSKSIPVVKIITQ